MFIETREKQVDLPAPIRAYFEADSGHDGDAVVAPFTKEAVVIDEAATHRGHAEIRAWWTQARAKYNQSTELLATTHDSDRTIVRCRVSGTFPQSPIMLDFAFTLAEQHIAQLEIR
jgi:hypothetical protein